MSSQTLGAAHAATTHPHFTGLCYRLSLVYAVSFFVFSGVLYAECHFVNVESKIKADFSTSYKLALKGATI